MRAHVLTGLAGPLENTLKCLIQICPTCSILSARKLAVFRLNPFCSDCINSSLVNNAVSLSALASSPMTLVDKSPSAPPTAPSTSTQHRTKPSHPAPHSSPSQPSTGPHPVPPLVHPHPPSPSSDVASSRFFNRQSARSSTSSLGEEAIPVLLYLNFQFSQPPPIRMGK